MLQLPQGPRHSAQGDHADQPQFTEEGGHESGLGRPGSLGETRVLGKARSGSPVQSGLGWQHPGSRPSWQMQSWQSVLASCPGQ